jgi:hypothetical protein
MSANATIDRLEDQIKKAWRVSSALAAPRTRHGGQLHPYRAASRLTVPTFQPILRPASGQPRHRARAGHHEHRRRGNVDGCVDPQGNVREVVPHRKCRAKALRELTAAPMKLQKG